MIEASGAANTVLVVGASGGIGRAVVDHYLTDSKIELVIAVSRSQQPAQYETYGERLRWQVCDYSEAAIAEVLPTADPARQRITRVVICNGILHSDTIAPEKSLLSLNAAAMTQVLHANTVVPALWLAALSKALRGGSTCSIAVLSARVGSISDNRLGGWYSYRASKAALNMVLKSAAIEYSRKLPQVKLVAFHPGTTDTELSKPFQRGVAPEALFTPEFVAQKLTSLLDKLEPDEELSYLAWDGTSIEW
ncbi:MAG: NAD(P)-dependent dehydrogenase (short-subunit alcohol dehydrogenase family) [Alcanivorax sp.]|jgi:NAD(P)-dependent dehydrogenase (short-subunit alcohol dehydrogenase family)